jgi:CRISPR-associated endonuclease Cas1
MTATAATPVPNEDTAERVSLQFRDPSRTSGVCVADGYGVTLSVERGHLMVRDGLGPYRRERRFSRATHGLRRVVVLGHSGQITFDALRWMAKAGVGYIQLTQDGEVLASSGTGRDDARLRRAQALAAGSPVGLAICRDLLAAKLSGQAANLRDRFAAQEAAAAVDSLLEDLVSASTVEEARGLEATAAIIYFDAWVGRPEAAPVFTPSDAKQIPVHWTRFEGRRSVLGTANFNRKAERPTNAILNYLFGLVEAEARRACVAVGLDPGLGVLHSDAVARDSLALDVIEPVRPRVERFALDLLAQRIFRRRDFAEGLDGSCRLLPPLTHELAASLRVWEAAIGPWAEFAAATLGKSMDGKFRISRPLTGSTRRDAQARVKGRRAVARESVSPQLLSRRPSRAAPTSKLEATSRCLDCGGPLARSQHLRCPHCWSSQPGQSDDVRRRRGSGIARTRAELERWKISHDHLEADPATFAPIREGLVQVKLREIMGACQVSKSTASMIRSGKHVPAERHWGALMTLATTPTKATG